ncbi:MAG: zinc ribbon domain-containing protein [Promethearchaeota archaeon]
MSIQEQDISEKYVMTSSDTLFKILQALSFKGGSSSVPSLKIAVMLEDNVIKAALKAGQILKFLEIEEEDYILTDIGENVLDVSQKEKQDIIAKYLFEIEGYRDIVFRMKMAPKHEMAMKDLAKAFYILEKDMREELRKAVIDSFVDFALYANIIEKNNNSANPGVILTGNGESQLENAINAKKRKKKGSAAPAAANLSSSELTCPACGKGIMADFVVCPYCATPLKHECPNCGKELQPGWKACPFCGNPV